MNINKETSKLNKMLEKAKGEIEKIDLLILDLYPDWKEGIISRDEYVKLKQKLDDKKVKLSAESKIWKIVLKKLKTDRIVPINF